MIQTSNIPVDIRGQTTERCVRFLSEQSFDTVYSEHGPSESEDPLSAFGPRKTKTYARLEFCRRVCVRVSFHAFRLDKDLLRPFFLAFLLLLSPTLGQAR